MEGHRTDKMIIDIFLLAIIGVVTWCVASEGAWGAALTCLCVIFSGLLAMNFFEPLANQLQSSISLAGDWRHRWDIVSLVGLFTGFIFLFRILTEKIAPSYVQMNEAVHNVGRWAAALLTGYVAMAFLLTALHTAALPREFLDFRPERKNLFNQVAPDRQWLGFTQYVSEKVFRQGSTPRLFDGPVLTVGEHDNEVWPSFPIRYATRRERLLLPPTATAGTAESGVKRKDDSKKRTRTSAPSI